MTGLAVLIVLAVSSHSQQQQTTALEKQAQEHTFGGSDGFGDTPPRPRPFSEQLSGLHSRPKHYEDHISEELLERLSELVGSQTFSQSSLAEGRGVMQREGERELFGELLGTFLTILKKTSYFKDL